MVENREEDHDDEEKQDRGNIVVKFFVLLFLGLIIVVILAMLLVYILRFLGYYVYPFDLTPTVTFVIGVVFGYIARDLSLRRSKK